ncbi:hypothetical protein [Streptomyces marispadix]|uniref:Uncharacterized protein n=1 Tax=Streptomyces marispadix TaxID=2922868 RepID=A0ABS9SY76_9ACTN|nr:hypothetical protein [Streptomyces marispadix]MCH6161143.1 hypothetical protein [Streptomyces marispadix]
MAEGAPFHGRHEMFLLAAIPTAIRAEIPGAIRAEIRAEIPGAIPAETAETSAAIPAVVLTPLLIPALVPPRSLSHAPTVSAPVTGGPGPSLSDRIPDRERTLGAGRRWLRSGTGAGTCRSSPRRR